MADQKQTDFSTWKLDKLSDYIVNTHHTYERAILSEMGPNSELVAKKHEAEYPELARIDQTLKEMAKALEDHMAGEEKYLFPYVKKLLKAKEDGTKLPKPSFGTIEKPLEHHYEEHDNVWNLMKKIRDLSMGFKVPADACDEHKVLYQQLSGFEKDLQQHIYLENEVLFGGSIKLEKEVTEQ